MQASTRARRHTRSIDVLIALVVGLVLLGASHAETVRHWLAGLERAVLGRSVAAESGTASAVARTSQGLLDALEAFSYDRRLELRANLNPCPVDKRLLITEIDDASLFRFGR